MADLWIDYDDLQEKYGETMANNLFEEFKTKKPTQAVNREFADYIISKLPKGMATYISSNWGLENEDSDSFLQWCEHHYLHIPSINATAFIEIGDYHYYVDIQRNCIGDGWWDNRTCKHQEDVIDYIIDTVEHISINDDNMAKSEY